MMWQPLSRAAPTNGGVRSVAWSFALDERLVAALPAAHLHELVIVRAEAVVAQGLLQDEDETAVTCVHRQRLAPQRLHRGTPRRADKAQQPAVEPHEREQVRAGLILHVRDHVVRGRVADDAAPGAHRLHEIGRARRVLDLHGKPAAGKDAVLHGRVHRQIVGGAKLDEPDGGQGSHGGHIISSFTTANSRYDSRTLHTSTLPAIGVSLSSPQDQRLG